MGNLQTTRVLRCTEQLKHLLRIIGHLKTAAPWMDGAYLQSYFTYITFSLGTICLALFVSVSPDAADLHKLDCNGKKLGLL